MRWKGCAGEVCDSDSLCFQGSRGGAHSSVFSAFSIGNSVIRICGPTRREGARANAAVFSKATFICTVRALPSFIRIFLACSGAVVFRFASGLIVFSLRSGVGVSVYFSMVSNVNCWVRRRARGRYLITIRGWIILLLRNSLGVFFLYFYLRFFCCGFTWWSGVRFFRRVLLVLFISNSRWRFTYRL